MSAQFWSSKEPTYEIETISGGCRHDQSGPGAGARRGTGATTGGSNRNAALRFQGRTRGGPESAVHRQLRVARGAPEEDDECINTYVWLPDHDYAIIMRKMADDSRRLITAYWIAYGHERKKLRRKYEQRVRK